MLGRYNSAVSEQLRYRFDVQLGDTTRHTTAATAQRNYQPAVLVMAAAAASTQWQAELKHSIPLRKTDLTVLPLHAAAVLGATHLGPPYPNTGPWTAGISKAWLRYHPLSEQAGLQ